ncbi:MAG TPA: aminoacyl-tRNA hydrolase [Casimicrobiaceae bacterium]|nr:aminoacyl-tRNA hydrolase [Casimicrobiaceae bacterium]
MNAPIRLVVGLGNPGREHEATRHNAGFWFVDALAHEQHATFANEARFFGTLAKVDGGVRLLKPTTFMNLSGRAAQAVQAFYAIAPEAMLVVHDELDVPPGEARLKFGGGVAGHNGLKDLRAQLATADFWRLRLGIGHPRDSVFPQQPPADYVLRPPSSSEKDAIDQAIKRSLDVWPALVAGDFERAMTSLHTKDAK